MGSKDRWPDFLVIGAPRSGTTTLHALLDSAPSVCMSSIKEPRYFNRGIDFTSHFTHSVTEREDYFDLWNTCSEEQVRGEVTPTYFHDPLCPAAVREVIPRVRLVLIARNPVERAVSHYHFKEKRTGRSSRTLRQAIDLAKYCRPGDYEHGYLLEPGFYGKHLQRWLEFFEGDQIKIMLLERLASNFQEEMEELFRFIEAPLEEARSLERATQNAAAVPRFRTAGRVMQARSVRKIVEFFRAENLAATIASRLLIKQSEYPKPPEEDCKRLYNIYGDDVRCFESLTGLETGWLD